MEVGAQLAGGLALGPEATAEAIALPWPALAWPGLAWPGLAWPGLARPGLPCPALAWPGLPCPALPWPGLPWQQLPALLGQFGEDLPGRLGLPGKVSLLILQRRIF